MKNRFSVVDVKVLRSADVLDFGKYKGKTVREIFQEDFNYLIWLNENSENVVVDMTESHGD